MTAAVEEGASHTELRTRLAKLEGKTTGGGASNKLTLATLAKQGDIELPWLSLENHEPVKRANTKKKYLTTNLTDGYQLVVVSNDNGLSCTVNIRKIEAEKTETTEGGDGAEKTEASE
jgi:hypothetical protein